MQVPAVCLEMHDSFLLEEVAVAVHEKRRCKTFLLTADLRICECDPDLGNLTGSKKRLDEFDAGTEETDILQAMLFSIFGTLPESRTLDVDTYIIE